jgi:hypothetical protein
MPGHTHSTETQARLISWQEAVAILEACDEKGVPVPFSIRFCTADESKATGGEIITYERAIWHVKNGRVQRSPGFKRAEPRQAEPRQATDAPINFMRRIRAVDSDQIRAVYIHLIMVINGHPVR